MHLPNSTHPWPTLHPPWSPGLPQWEDHRQPRTNGPGRGTGPETRWRVLLRQVRPWHVLCSGLNHWIRRLETDAFNSLPNKWLWQWRWVVERILTIETSERFFMTPPLNIQRWSKIYRVLFNRCCHLAKPSWRLSCQPWEDTDDKSRRRTDCVLKGRSPLKKQENMEIFPKSATPPLLHLKIPCLWKYFMVYFSF